jgi:hypothetical protein
VRLTSVRARAVRVARAGGRTSTVIRVVLRRPHALRVVVIGPSPSCAVAGELHARGRTGVNRLLFRGRTSRRALRPGTYTLIVHPLAPSADGIVVRVTKRGDAVPVRTTKSRCERRTTIGAATPTFGSGTPALTALGVALAPVASEPAVPAGNGKASAPASTPQPATATEVASSPHHFPTLLPKLPGEDGHALLSLIVTLAFLATIALMLAAVANLLVRFLRGSWNP